MICSRRISGRRFRHAGASAGAIAVLLAIAAGVSPVAADTVELTAVRDNSMYSENGDRSNGAGESLFVGSTTRGEPRRCLIQFDTSEIPVGAQITDVRLRVQVTNASPGSPSAVVNAHRALAEWGEGTSDAGSPGGAGAVATTDDATWTHRLYPGTTWTTDGGDFVSGPSGSQTLAGDGQYELAGSGLIDDVMAWLAGTEPNHGWILVGDEASSGSAKRLASREASIVSSRPVLIVTFDPPTPVESGSWSRFKSRFH